MNKNNSWFASDMHKFLIGDIRTDGWKSDWRQEFERRSAEDAEKPSVVTAPQIQTRQRRAEGCNPKPKYIPVVPKKLCDGCGKGLRNSTVGTKCQRCLRARPKCACGRTVTLAGAGDQCKECFHKASRKKCAKCDKLLNASNQYGLCKQHYGSMRRSIHQEELLKCCECDRLVSRHNKYGRCREHSRRFYALTFNQKRRELKVAA